MNELVRLQELRWRKEKGEKKREKKEKKKKEKENEKENAKENAKEKAKAKETEKETEKEKKKEKEQVIHTPSQRIRWKDIGHAKAQKRHSGRRCIAPIDRLSPWIDRNRSEMIRG